MHTEVGTRILAQLGQVSMGVTMQGLCLSVLYVRSLARRLHGHVFPIILQEL